MAAFFVCASQTHILGGSNPLGNFTLSSEIAEVEILPSGDGWRRLTPEAEELTKESHGLTGSPGVPYYGELREG